MGARGQIGVLVQLGGLSTLAGTCCSNPCPTGTSPPAARSSFPAPGAHPGYGSWGVMAMPDLPSHTGDPTTPKFSVSLSPTHILNDTLTFSFHPRVGVWGCPVTNCAFTNGRVQHPPRSSMPRIRAGPRVSSLPPRKWAGVPPSWCKCHCHQSGERMAESCHHHGEGTQMVG